MLFSSANLSALAEDNVNSGAVAKIGEVSYVGLSEALTAAKDGDTIELLAGTYEFGK